MVQAYPHAGQCTRAWATALGKEVPLAGERKTIFLIVHNDKRMITMGAILTNIEEGNACLLAPMVWKKVYWTLRIVRT